MWERQNVIWIFLELLFAVLIDNADDTHNHRQDYEQNDEDYDPNDVTGKEDLAYKFLYVSIAKMIASRASFKAFDKCSFLKGKGRVSS